MLFDLRGKRRKLVQVVYAVLAALFLISFVGFGIGSDVSGGIFDALGVGGGDSTSSNPQYESQIDSAEEKLAQDPKDEKALLALTRAHYLAGQSALEQDAETGTPVLTDEASEQFAGALDAWDRYLKTKPQKPDGGLALQLIQAYQVLAQSDTDPTELQLHLEGGREAARIASEAQPSPNTYFTLAQFAYLSGDVQLGEEAAANALKQSSDSERKQLEKVFTTFEDEGKRIQKQIKQQSAGKEQLEAPLGGLGGAQPTPQPAP